MSSLTSLKLFLVYRIMTLSSFFGVIVFYLVASKSLEAYYPKLPIFFHNIWVASIFVVLIFGLLSWLSLLACRIFPSGNTMQSEEIKPIENIAMPTYIGLFVIALEIGGSLSTERSAIVLLILFVLWWLFERVFYFNPVWLLFGYRFYEAKTAEGNTFTVISKSKNLKGQCSFNNLKKINEYTYMETN